MSSTDNPIPGSCTVVFRHAGTQARIGLFALPYVPLPGDVVLVDRIAYRVMDGREWDLDEVSPDTAPHVTVILAPLVPPAGATD